MFSENQNNAKSVDRDESLLNFRPWRELAVSAFILMEMSWAGLWYRALINPKIETSYLWIFMVFSSIVLSSYTGAWIVNLLYLNLRTRRTIFGFIVLANILWGLKALLFRTENVGISKLILAPFRALEDWSRILPIEFIIIFLILVLCWRGMSLASNNIAPDTVIGGFRIGILMFLGYGALLIQSAPAPSLALMIFIISGVVTLSAGRIVVLSQLRGGRRIPFDRTWLSGIIISALVIAGVAAIIFNLTQGERFQFVYVIFSWIIYGLVLLFSPLLWLLSRALFFIGEVLRLDQIFELLIGFFQNLKELVQSALVVIREIFSDVEPEQVERALSVIKNLRAIILWGSIIFFAIILILSIRRYFTREKELDDDDFQSLLDEQDLFGLIKNAIRKGVERLLDGFGNALQIPITQQFLAAARIRRIYARLMRLSAKLDYPRPPSRTPLEFLPSLFKLFPQHSSELETITNAYSRVRYGELPETSAEVEIVDRAWKRVSTAGQGMLKLRKPRRVK